jgi:hypothetical protein
MRRWSAGLPAGGRRRTMGYEAFLAAISDPKHDEHEHWTEWIGGRFDADEFDLAAVNDALKDFA